MFKERGEEGQQGQMKMFAKTASCTGRQRDARERMRKPKTDRERERKRARAAKSKS